jgi:hypothetical protein
MTQQRVASVRERHIDPREVLLQVYFQQSYYEVGVLPEVATQNGRMWDAKWQNARKDRIFAPC